MRLDFLVHRYKRKPLLLEVKTCTLCHNGVAMFPDAPSGRALRHIENLNRLAAGGYETRMLFIIPNGSAKLFVPNFHTGYDFTMKFLEHQPLNFSASKIRLAGKRKKVFWHIDFIAPYHMSIEKGCQHKN